MQTALLAALDDEQRAAVAHPGGPCLVLAGPGAGKTRTLTHRVSYLVEHGVDPSAILCVTFTKKATEEMEERLTHLIGDRVADLGLGTIHATCYRLLRRWWKHTGQPALDVISDGVVGVIVNMLLDRPWARNEIGLDLAVRKVRAQDLHRFWSACRDLLLDPESVRPDMVPALVGPRFEEIGFECRSSGVRPASNAEWIESYRRFQRTKRDQQGLDFDDMAPLLWQAWGQDPGLLALHQNQFQHVLIDEFQDTSYGQWALLRRIAEPQNNVFAVGDCDQSMYGFRFARPEFTVKFHDYYPTAKLYPVGTNYRSVPAVVERSVRLIQHNTERVPITLRAHRGALDGQQAIAILSPDDEEAEAAQIAADIRDGYMDRLDSVAVLYRVNRYSANLELALLREGIPYRIVGGLSFFAHKPVADVLAYLRLAEDHSDSKAFSRAIGAPSRFLGREFIRQVQARAGIKGDLLAAIPHCAVSPTQAENAAAFARLVAGLPTNPVAAIRQLRASTRYDDWVISRGVDRDGDEQNQDRLEILDQLEHVAEGYDTRAELLAYADVVLEAVDQEDDASGRVTLTTIHRAKGLEWPVVYVAGMIDGIMPHTRSYAAGPAAVEEERRIAYVAMTRARDRLVLSRPAMVGGRGVDPSPFLAEAGL
jgi:DNA helicase-2/ATP-dependent DNA helicase PcrA